jgi:hypothetical protein
MQDLHSRSCLAVNWLQRNCNESVSETPECQSLRIFVDTIRELLRTRSITDYTELWYNLLRFYTLCVHLQAKLTISYTSGLKPSELSSFFESIAIATRTLELDP